MTRQDAPVSPPAVLTIAGSDSGGGAGIQADLKTVEACGGYGASAVTSVTAQNTTGVESTHVLPVEEIDAQLVAVRSDLDVAAIKTGMLATSDVIDLVTEHVREADAPAVVDPVMVAASGDRLLAEDAEDAYETLIAEATLVTPNADEAEVITGVDLADERDVREAGDRIVGMGADAALIKGGHLPGEDVIDVLVTDDAVETFRHERVDTDATHGSGCALSSAIATHLAHGERLADAVGAGVDLLARAVRYNLDVGEGPGAVHHLVEARDAAARDDAVEAVEQVVEAFVDRDVSRLVPEVGTNVVGATPYAERPGETAAVEGRIARTMGGVRPNRGVRFGASSHVSRVLLAAREYDADLQFGTNLMYDDDVAAALAVLGWPTVELDREGAPGAIQGEDGAVLKWATREALADADESPVAVVDRGGEGTVPMVYPVATEPDALVDYVVTLTETVEG